MSTITTTTAAATSGGLTRLFWGALAGFLVLQTGLAFALDQARAGVEFANDAYDYQKYVQNPNLLWYDITITGVGGGFITSPLLPYLLYLPYKVFTAFGISEQHQLFLGLRLTMIFWFAVGLIFTWKVVQPEFRIGSRAYDWLFALLMIFLPLNIIAPAVMVQDDCVTFAWIGFSLYAWRRWGIGTLVACLVAGVWLVKPFILFAFPAVWMAYPAWRLRIVGLFVLTTAALLGFFYWRDGSVHFFDYAMNGSLSPTLYSVAWLWQDPIDMSRWNAHGVQTRSLSTPLFLVTMSIWCLSSWFKKYQLPAAVTGTYAVFFLTLTAVMPEYDLWFLPWMIWVMWEGVRSQDWLLCACCWLHSTIGYAYKLFYACDSKHFSKFRKSPLEDFYKNHFDYDLRYVFIALAIAATLCRIGIVVSLWRARSRSQVEMLSE